MYNINHLFNDILQVDQCYLRANFMKVTIFNSNLKVFFSFTEKINHRFLTSFGA